MTMIGVYVGNSPAEVAKFDEWLGQPADAVHGFIGRADWKDFVGSADWATKLWAGIDKQVLWSVPLITNNASLSSAATGAYNDYYAQVATILADAQPTGAIVVRTGWEFNGGWFPWSAAGREQTYIDAFRQFVDSFRAVSDRFTFEWTPNHGDLGMNPEKAYPGDDYVDIIGMDFYHNTGWDPKDPEAAWTKMVTAPYGLQWHQDFAAAHGKQTAYSEWGVMTDGVGPYIQHASDWFAKYDVAYQSYWNSNVDYSGKLSDGKNPATGAEYRDEFGGPLQNVVEGGAGNDTLTGTDRSERLDGKAGADSMRGGKGDDTYYVDNVNDRVIELAGEGKDEIRSRLAVTTLAENVENLTLLSTGNQTGIGNALDNRIVGGTGHDTLDGGAGNDWLMGGVGNDTFLIRPGTGRDTIADFQGGPGAGDVVRLDSFSIRSFDQVKAAMEQFGKDTILSLPGGDVVVFTNRKATDFAADDFVFTGTPPAPPPVWRPAAPATAPTGTQYSRTGTGGDDVMVGADLNDYINGTGGTDTMIGGKGHDIYVVDRPQDVIVELPGEGIDSVDSWSGSYTLPDNVEHLTLIAGYAQTGTGNALANRIKGGSGNDTINGKAGNDWLTGGGGKNTFIVETGTGHDTITDFKAGEGAGDVVRLVNYGVTTFSQVKSALTQQGDDTLLTLPGSDTVLFLGRKLADFAADDFAFVNSGPVSPPPPPPPPPPPAPTTPVSNFVEPPATPGPVEWYRSGTGKADVINGGTMNDQIDGGGGFDTMAGGKGHDIYVVDQPQDVVIELAGEGIDTVRSWAKSFTLPDHVENIALVAGYDQNATGNALANRIEGGSGKNVLNGGAGNDWLKGGAGNDTFVFQKGTGYDIVADFQAGAGPGDVARLENVGFTSFAQVKSAMAQNGADTILTLSATDAVLFRNVSIGQFAADDFELVNDASAGAPPVPPAPGPAPTTTTITVRAAADSWKGDPLFRLTVDGQKLGADTAVSVQHGQGWQEFSFQTADTDIETVSVRFLNDDWGGSAATDRNLYVDWIKVGGTVYQAEDAAYDRGLPDLLPGTEKIGHPAALIFNLGAM